MEDSKKLNIKQLVNKVVLILFLLGTTILSAQTAGFNYQALILNTVEIQVPGTNVTGTKVPLSSEDITLRFTITNEEGIEYIEEHIITTDENGMVSLIVGEGTPLNFTFNDIKWDGKLKYLNVELDIHSNNDGFVFLDTQKILYIPQPTNGTSNIKIVNTLGDLKPPYKTGDLIWVTNYGPNNNKTLMIWDAENWVPVNEDYDPTNEFGLIVVTNDITRDKQFNKPIIGNQVWNQSCECIQVFDGSKWVLVTTKVLNNLSNESLNGLHKDGNTTKLGGKLIEPTEILTDSTNTLAIKGLQESTNEEDLIVVADKNTGVLRQKPISSIIQRKEVTIIAIDGQLEFSTPLNITSTYKIDVYRNGIRIDFTAVNSTTIKLEPEAICFKDDKIRIVQLY